MILNDALYRVRKLDKEVCDVIQKNDTKMDLLYNRAFKNTFKEYDLNVYELFKEGGDSKTLVIPSVIVDTIYADIKGSVSVEDILELELFEENVLEIDFSRFELNQYYYIGYSNEDYHIERYAKQIEINDLDTNIMKALKTVMSETIQVIQDDDHRDKIRHLYSNISREDCSKIPEKSKNKDFIKKLDLIKYFAEKLEIKVSYRDHNGKLIHKSFEI